MKSERRIACRKQVAALLEAVLDGSIEARDAINCWPCFCNSDPSVQCAYTMLWYWEADEDRRWQEMMYSDLQFQQLQNCIQLLKLGHPLPHQLMIDYLERLAPEEFSERTWVSSPLRVLKRFGTWFVGVWKQSIDAFSPRRVEARTSKPSASAKEVSFAQLSAVSKASVSKSSKPSKLSSKFPFRL